MWLCAVFSPGVCDRYNEDRVYGKRILTLEFCGIWCHEIFLVKQISSLVELFLFCRGNVHDAVEQPAIKINQYLQYLVWKHPVHTDPPMCVCVVFFFNYHLGISIQTLSMALQNKL